MGQNRLACTAVICHDAVCSIIKYQVIFKIEHNFILSKYLSKTLVLANCHSFVILSVLYQELSAEFLSQDKQFQCQDKQSHLQEFYSSIVGL